MFQSKKERLHETAAEKQRCIMAAILYRIVTGVKASILLRKTQQNKTRRGRSRENQFSNEGLCEEQVPDLDFSSSSVLAVASLKQKHHNSDHQTCSRTGRREAEIQCYPLRRTCLKLSEDQL